MNPLHSRGFTWNINSYFLWNTMKKYLRMSSTAVMNGTFRVNWDFLYLSNMLWTFFWISLVSYSVHSRNLKTGAHRAPTWQKSGDITKKCGPTSYHSPHRSRLPLLAMLSLVRHCESLAPVKSLSNFEQEKSLSHEDWNNLFVSTFTKSSTPTSSAICLFPRHRPQPDLWSE